MRKVARRVAKGLSLNKAIRMSVPARRRSWVIRNWRAYQHEGFEALIDRRTPREPVLSRACEGLIQTARETDPEVTAERVLEILQDRKLKNLPSPSIIWLHFARVDARARYAKKKAQAVEKVEELPFAGGELLRAAELETGAIAALTNEVKTLAEEAEQDSRGQTPTRDVASRDDRGHFTGIITAPKRSQVDTPRFGVALAFPDCEFSVGPDAGDLRGLVLGQRDLLGRVALTRGDPRWLSYTPPAARRRRAVNRE